VLHLLENQIDIKQVPFSDRGSRLLVYQHADKPALYIKLAERLIHYEAGIESYLKRPPLIENLEFIDEDGNVLDFKTSSSAEMLRFETNIGQIQMRKLCRLVYQAKP
jgi:putative isomerase